MISKEPYIHHDEPAISFDESDEQFLAEAYTFNLVGKFVRRKPSMIKVCNNFMRFGFIGDYDDVHIIIHLTDKDAYSRLFLKPTWHIDGCPKRIIKSVSAHSKKFILLLSGSHCLCFLSTFELRVHCLPY